MHWSYDRLDLSLTSPSICLPLLGKQINMPWVCMCVSALDAVSQRLSHISPCILASFRIEAIRQDHHTDTLTLYLLLCQTDVWLLQPEA